MQADLIQLSDHFRGSNPALRTRVENAAALLRAIEEGELLSALPECPIARNRHKTALTLLGLLEHEFECLCAELRGGASNVVG
jgi:hypothetical protein